MAVNARAGEILNSYYSRTAYVRSNLQKWFLFSFITGMVIGLLVAGIHIIIYDEIWFHLRGLTGSYTLAFAFPVIGIVASAALVNKYSKRPGIHSTEEVIWSYNENNGRMDLASFPSKVIASILTIGFGGSAGMEGPSVYIGASIACWFRRIFSRFGFEDEDVRWMLLAGGAAGISAIFKAPLTGIVFGLEVPYKDDLAHDAFIPSLIASVTSYMVFVSVVGIGPLFKVPHVYTVNYSDLLLSIILGVICGLSARLFVLFFHWFSDALKRTSGRFVVKAILGSAVMGLVGVISAAAFDAPYALGTGYEAINDILTGKLVIWQLVGLFLLKVLGTSATMAAGGIGGIFIPMIFMGATIGAVFGEMAPVKSPLYPILGMAAFLGAGYNTPLAAATFIAETTGSPGFIIPGLIAAAVSYTVSGRRSVSTHQRYHKQTPLHRMLERKVGEVMVADVVTVPSVITIEQFVQDYLLKYRHKSFPVVKDTALYGMIALCDIRRVPTKDWSSARVEDVTIRDLSIAYPDQSLAEVTELMGELDYDRLPVVHADRPRDIIGIIAGTDIVRLEELSDFVEE